MLKESGIPNMNWYEMSRVVFKPKDIYTLYALQGMPIETLHENLRIFEKAAKKLNEIREYYLEHLCVQVAEELEHMLSGNAYDENEALESPYFNSVDVGFEEWLNDNYYDYQQPEEEEEKKEIPSYMMEELYGDYMNQVYDSIELNLDIEEMLVDAISAYGKWQPTKDAMEKAVFCFTELPWESAYGGQPWADIARWTYELYKTPPVDISLIHEGRVEAAKRQYDRLLYVIDVINSLHHNTGAALIDLPEGEGRWLTSVLEVIKHMPNQLGLALMSGNPQLLRAVKEYYRILPGYYQQPRTPQEAILQMAESMPEPYWKEFLLAAHLPVIDILLKTPGLDLTTLVSNTTVVQSPTLLQQVLKYIADNQGMEALKLAIGELLRQYPSARDTLMIFGFGDQRIAQAVMEISKP